MDDNKLLTLANGERIRLEDHCSILFEVINDFSHFSHYVLYTRIPTRHNVQSDNCVCIVKKLKSIQKYISYLLPYFLLQSFDLVHIELESRLAIWSMRRQRLWLELVSFTLMLLKSVSNRLGNDGYVNETTMNMSVCRFVSTFSIFPANYLFFKLTESLWQIHYIMHWMHCQWSEWAKFTEAGLSSNTLEYADSILLHFRSTVSACIYSETCQAIQWCHDRECFCRCKIFYINAIRMQYIARYFPVFI